MTRPSSGAAVVLGLASLVAALLVVDVVRQLQLGEADAQLAFFAGATCVAVASALAVGRRAQGRRIAVLILVWVSVGVLTDFGLIWPDSRVAATIWGLAVAVQPAVYAQMILAYPSGWVRDRLERSFVAVAYPVGLLWMAFPLLFSDPSSCGDCSPRVPSLFFVGAWFDISPLGKVFAGVFIALGVAFVALILRRLHRAPPGSRTTLLPLAAAGAFAAADFAILRVASLEGWSSLYTPLDWIDTATTLVVPVAIFVGIAEINRRRGPLGDLVVELSSAPAGQVGAALARTLGDPTLTLALWLPDRQVFVDEHGVEVRPAESEAGRAVTVIGPDEEPLAAIEHDERLLGQHRLLEAAGSAATLALENTRLQAELRAQLAEVRGSRTRIVTAADAERRRVERDLHDGAQQRLLALGFALQLLRDRGGDAELLTEAETELQLALAELRDLARGIHPAILTEQGLAAAIRSLADRSTLPVDTRLGDERYPPAIETAAFFLVSEALANVSKHAQASSASVTISRLNGKLVVEVSDDGRGGATARSGNGLQSLSDRVGALDGRLTIDSVAARGTTIRAEIPCASS